MYGDYISALSFAAYGATIALLTTVIIKKRRFMIASTTTSFRQQQLLRIATGACAVAPTIIFVWNEDVSCIAAETFNTHAIRARAVDPDDNLLSNSVERACASQIYASFPMLMACVHFSVGQWLSFRESQITIERLMTLQLPFLDILDCLLASIKVFFAAAMFCFRNSDWISAAFMSTALHAWIALFGASVLSNYLRDRWSAKDAAAAQPAETAENKPIRPTKQLSGMGISSRTKARRSIVQLGKNEILTRGANKSGDADRKSEKEGPGFDLNPGLM